MKQESMLAVPGDSHTLFPQFAFTFRYRDWPFDKKLIMDAIYDSVDKQEKDIDSDIAPNAKTKGLKESKFDFVDRGDEYPVLDKVKNFFEQAVLEVVHHALPHEGKEYEMPFGLDVECVIQDSWYHVTNDLGSHGVHSHGGSSWSGIFYINTKECDIDTGNGINKFYNVHSVNGQGDAGSMWYTQNNVFSLQPKEGMLIVFPSWIHHDGTAYQGKEDRVLISFNSVVLPAEEVNAMRSYDESK
tara:strand:+ start:415 stop:1143 length:729 start_codon:yes stop_codon:yes gene_type:complete